MPDVELGYKLRSRRNGGAGWCFVIGGITLINAVLWMGGSDIRMIMGLFSTRLLIRVLGTAGAFGQMLELLAAIAAAGMFVILGYLVRKGFGWAMWAAAGLYAADFAIYLVFVGVSDVFGLAFRGFALASLFSGAFAIRALAAGRDIEIATAPDGGASELTLRRVGQLVLMTLGGVAIFAIIGGLATWFVLR